MKTVAMILALASASNLSADLTMVLQTQRAGAPAIESTLYASSGNWRLENAQGGYLHKARQEGHFALNHPAKGYTEVEWKSALISDHADMLVWERTRSAETIAGVPARKWVGRSGKKVKAEVWFGGTANAFEDLADATQGLRGEVGELLPSVPGKFPVSEGYILRWVRYDDSGRVRTRTQVKSIARGNVDAKWFELPADYALLNPPPEPKVPGDPKPPPLVPTAKSGDE